MKKNMGKYKFTVLVLLYSIIAFADNPPPPNPNGAPPAPIGLPIDQWIIPMMGIALVFGILMKISGTTQRKNS